MVRNFRVGLNIYSITLRAGVAIWKLLSRTMTGHFAGHQVHSGPIVDIIELTSKML